MTTTATTHEVVPGDTLWAIASKHYGDGARWVAIYHANADTIREAAQAHGKWDPDDPGHWIFPGTVLVLPELGA